ncbi:MAG: hypothetical protein Q9220_005233 [cf. Caloplaca sp. 1 TL-2023]
MTNKAPIDGYVDPNVPNPNGDGDAPIVIYGYTPHISLSALAVALFAILLGLHVYRLRTTRLYAFSILLIFTTVCEIIGYVFRIRSGPNGDPYLVVNFVVQYFFIVCAPVFLSAAIYTTLTSFMGVLSQDHTEAGARGGVDPLGLSKRTILAIFITSDVVATIVQVAGAALIGSAESDRISPDNGNNILLAGLAFQVFSFLVFLILLFVFLRNSRKVMLSNSTGEGGRGNMMQMYSAALVASSLLVYLRTCFRLAETAEGVMGYASSHEAFFGALEFAPIVLAIAMLGWWHPGRLVGRNGLLSANPV